MVCNVYGFGINFSPDFNHVQIKTWRIRVFGKGTSKRQTRNDNSKVQSMRLHGHAVKAELTAWQR